MSTQDAKIRHVSDTALWVAFYRALESERPDALFKDELARLLVGERGQAIARAMKASSPYTRWSVIIRTVVIDRFIQRLAADGVELVLNLGAGMDTRPYRLNVAPGLRWIEVDYPNVIEHKAQVLAQAEPRVELERIALDLLNRAERQILFGRLSSEAKRVVVLTEGVIPYLSQEQMGLLADDLHEQSSFEYWIGEYYSPKIYRYIQTKKRMKQLKHAPFQFFPEDWFGFFKAHGWVAAEVQYLMEEGKKLNRLPPWPWWAHLMKWFIRKKARKEGARQMGYVVYKKGT
jgi:methyltransferase (TIGR00027 family)